MVLIFTLSGSKLHKTDFSEDDHKKFLAPSTWRKVSYNFMEIYFAIWLVKYPKLRGMYQTLHLNIIKKIQLKIQQINYLIYVIFKKSYC